MKYSRSSATRDSLSDWALRTGASTEPMLRLGPSGLELSPGSGPREHLVEITEFDSRSLARVITISFALLGIIATFFWGLLLLIDLRIDLPGITLRDAWFQIPGFGVAFLATTYVSVRVLCWFYNRIAGRFGGVVLRVKE